MNTCRCNSSFSFDDDKKIHSSTEDGGEGCCLLSGDEGAVDQKKKGLDRSATKCTDIFETNAQSRVERVV